MPVAPAAATSTQVRAHPPRLPRLLLLPLRGPHPPRLLLLLLLLQSRLMLPPRRGMPSAAITEEA